MSVSAAVTATATRTTATWAMEMGASMTLSAATSAGGNDVQQLFVHGILDQKEVAGNGNNIVSDNART